MIGRQIERLRRSQSIDQLVVATSMDAADDPLAVYLSELGVPVVRGPLDDVLGRFLLVLDEYPDDVVVRLTADCPLTSHAVIDEAVGRFLTGESDYLSNTLEPTFPDGLDVEVTTSDALRWVAEHSHDPHEREHVTLGIYRRPERFTCRNFVADADLSDLRWTVDAPDDLEFVRWVYSHLYRRNPDFDISDILSLLERHPERSRTSRQSARNAALNGLATGAMMHRRT